MEDRIVKIELPAKEGSWGFVVSSLRVLKVLNENSSSLCDAERGMHVRLTYADGTVRDGQLPYDLVHTLFPFWRELGAQKCFGRDNVLNTGPLDTTHEPHPEYLWGQIFLSRLGLYWSFQDREAIDLLLRLKEHRYLPHMLQLDAWVSVNLHVRASNGSERWYCPLAKCLATIQALRERYDLP